jgi:hypothetical protein
VKLAEIFRDPERFFVDVDDMEIVATGEKYAEDQLRDDHGRFASEGGGQLATELRKHGGFTYQPISHDHPKSGFALSIHPDRERFYKSPKSVSPDRVKQFIRNNRDLLKDKSNYVGGWHRPDDGVFLDISRIVKSDSEARALSVAHRQDAYYDLATDKTVTVGAHK